MRIVKVLAGIAFLGSVVWLIAQPDYEPAIAVVTSLSTLVGAIFIERRRETDHAAQTQTVGAGGVGVQAGRDVSIGTAQASNAKVDDVR